MTRIDARRLIVELRSLAIACEECGHEGKLRPRNLLSVNERGVHNFGQLCRRVACSRCPPTPYEKRRLRLLPVWLSNLDGCVENNLVN